MWRYCAIQPKRCRRFALPPQSIVLAGAATEGSSNGDGGNNNNRGTGGASAASRVGAAAIGAERAAVRLDFGPHRGRGGRPYTVVVVDRVHSGGHAVRRGRDVRDVPHFDRRGRVGLDDPG